jgi:hypothetical protein
LDQTERPLPAQRGVALRLFVEVGGETDATALRCRRVHQLSDGREHGLIVGGEILLDARYELIEALALKGLS